MKAYHINMHLLVPRSSAKVKVKYKGYIFQKMAVSGALVFHKHILFSYNFYAPVLIDRGHIVFACQFVCLYVCKKNLPLAIFFDWQVTELSCFRFAFLFLRNFIGTKVKVICNRQSEISVT